MDLFDFGVGRPNVAQQADKAFLAGDPHERADRRPGVFGYAMNPPTVVVLEVN